jgi:hypothetical protein
MKLSYDRQSGRYVISQLGTVIDSSEILIDLLIRYGIAEDDSELTPFGEAKGDDYDTDLDRLFEDLLEIN